PNSGAGAGPTSAAVDSTTEADGEAPIVTDDELLSDEDRVVSLLRDRGGRMKQVNIVDETGWSKSKVSMLLSEMEEDGRISKLRVGRENVISLKGHEPDAAGSPFDGDE
ncbi:helix-turn-helix transcriptional regulator, partial [Halobium palmae]